MKVLGSNGKTWMWDARLEVDGVASAENMRRFMERLEWNVKPRAWVILVLSESHRVAVYWDLEDGEEGPREMVEEVVKAEAFKGWLKRKRKEKKEEKEAREGRKMQAWANRPIRGKEWEEAKGKTWEERTKGWLRE